MHLKKWKHELWEVNKLHENPSNPRILSNKQGEELRKSLDKFGQCEPIVIQPDGTIIGGHQRVRILKRMGEKCVYAYVPENPLSEEEFKELTIRLNKNTGDWDYDALANEWETELLLESGFSSEELHLSIDNVESKPVTYTITCKFENEYDLRKAEINISSIMQEYLTASYKVKIK